MKPEEARDFLLEQRRNGASDNEILGTLYAMFQDDAISVEMLGELVSLIGYELTEEFLNMSPEDQKIKGWGDDNNNEESNK